MRTMQQQLKEKGLTTKSVQDSEKEVRVIRDRPLSEWELAQLMGTNRQTYRRVRGGAIRRR